MAYFSNVCTAKLEESLSRHFISDKKLRFQGLTNRDGYIYTVYKIIEIQSKFKFVKFNLVKRVMKFIYNFVNLKIFAIRQILFGRPNLYFSFFYPGYYVEEKKKFLIKKAFI